MLEFYRAIENFARYTSWCWLFSPTFYRRQITL